MDLLSGVYKMNPRHEQLEKEYAQICEEFDIVVPNHDLDDLEEEEE